MSRKVQNRDGRVRESLGQILVSPERTVLGCSRTKDRLRKDERHFKIVT
jgi:hypothetical protein